jgi:galactose-1-phosphate uridylyltransferase
LFEISHVLMFENKGEVVGVSNPHPHGQIYATNFVFRTIEVEDDACRRHLAATRRVLFQDILAAEHEDERRILCEKDSAIAFVPFFARYAYEVFVAPQATHPSIASLSGRERYDLACVPGHAREVRQPVGDAVPYVMAFTSADGRRGSRGLPFPHRISPGPQAKPARHPPLEMAAGAPERHCPRRRRRSHALPNMHYKHQRRRFEAGGTGHAGGYAAKMTVSMNRTSLQKRGAVWRGTTDA